MSKLNEAITARSKAFWLSPSKKIIEVPTNHIESVTKSPKTYGLTQEYIDSMAKKHGGVKELRDGGKARDEIMTNMLLNGWVRVRKVEARGNESWTIQLQSSGRSLPRAVKNTILNWAEKMVKKNEFWGDDNVMVMDTNGNLLFGGQGFNRKTIDDIIMDDTGVFEAIEKSLEQANILFETSLSRVVKHMDEHDCGTITAFRGVKDYNRPYSEENRYTKKENKQRNSSLRGKLQSLGYDITSVKGSYIEGYKGENPKEVPESVFFVVDSKDSGKLKKDLMKLGELFDQDSVLYIPLGGKYAELIGTNHSDSTPSYHKIEKLNKRTLGKEGQFMTRVNGRPFIFEEVNHVFYNRKDVSYRRGINILANLDWRDIQLSEEEEASLVNESSLSRIWSANIEHDCGAMTAFRKGPNCGEGTPYTKKENVARNKSLTAKLKAKGYGITKLSGMYPEGGKTLKETSYFIVDLNDTGKLLNDLKSLGKEFDQDSVLFIPKGSIKGEDKAYLIGTNTCDNNWLGFGKKEVFAKGKLGYDSKIYTSYVNGRPFIFETVDKEITSPASGFGTWSMYMASQKHWKELLD